jgi:hypothetical protein
MVEKRGCDMTDKEIADQVTRLRIKANMLRMGERIAFGSDSYALECAAETIERLIRERAAAVHLGKAGAYKANPEYTWAEWAADRQKELDAAEARVAELEEALRLIKDHPENSSGTSASWGLGWAFHNVQQIARAALEAWPRANRALGLPRIIGEDKT